MLSAVSGLTNVTAAEFVQFTAAQAGILFSYVLFFNDSFLPQNFIFWLALVSFSRLKINYI